MNNIAITGVGDFFSIDYNSSGQLTGRFTIGNVLSQSYKGTVSLVRAGLVGNVKLADFTFTPTLTNPLPNTTNGPFTSTSNGWAFALNDVASNQKDYVVTFKISIFTQATTHNFYFNFSIIPFSCPDYDYKSFDIISVTDMQTILSNPCCECYPNGYSGSQIVFDDVTCSPTGAGC